MHNKGGVIVGYITEDYYNNTYKGEAVSGSLATLIERASDVINMITSYKIGDIDSLGSVFVASQVQKATACQVEYIDQNGGMFSGGLSYASLGKFSFSGGNNNADKTLICPMVYSYLEPTGLLYRGL